jgi:hypothetical protein
VAFLRKADAGEQRIAERPRSIHQRESTARERCGCCHFDLKLPICTVTLEKTGVSNVVFMSGDDLRNGDHPDAKAVFDLDIVQMLAAARAQHRAAI